MPDLPEMPDLPDFSSITGGLPDESVEETYFRLIIESAYFDGLDPNEREALLLELAQQCITWVQDKENY